VKTIKHLAFLFLILLNCSAFAQTGIKGVVKDKITGETLIGANVIIDSIQPSVGAPTQLDGDYIINIKPGTYTIRCSELIPLGVHLLATKPK